MLENSKEFPITAELRGVRIGTKLFTLALPIANLMNLEEDVGSAYGLYARFLDGTWKVAEVDAVLLHSLMGGGISFEAAIPLIKSHFVAGYVAEFAIVARNVLRLAFQGIPDDIVEDKTDPGSKKKPAVRKSNGARSSGSAVQPDSPQK